MMDLVDRHPLKEKRRANKPLLERKRRAKINDSLTDLKYLVLSSLNKDVSKYAKMEKVDILDMTVQFLRGQCIEKRTEDCSSVFRAGYTECTKEMYQNIMAMDGVDHATKCRILSNLASNRSLENTIPSPPPSPVLQSIQKSPIPSPTGSPIKPCVSTIFDPAMRRVVMSNSHSNVPMLAKEHCVKCPGQMGRTVIQTIPSGMSDLNCRNTKLRCVDPKLYCNDNKSSGVWRPW